MEKDSDIIVRLHLPARKKVSASGPSYFFNAPKALPPHLSLVCEPKYTTNDLKKAVLDAIRKQKGQDILSEHDNIESFELHCRLNGVVLEGKASPLLIDTIGDDVRLLLASAPIAKRFLDIDFMKRDGTSFGVLVHFETSCPQPHDPTASPAVDGVTRSLTAQALLEREKKRNRWPNYDSFLLTATTKETVFQFQERALRVCLAKQRAIEERKRKKLLAQRKRNSRHKSDMFEKSDALQSKLLEASSDHSLLGMDGSNSTEFQVLLSRYHLINALDGASLTDNRKMSDYSIPSSSTTPRGDVNEDERKMNRGDGPSDKTTKTIKKTEGGKTSTFSVYIVEKGLKTKLCQAMLSRTKMGLDLPSTTPIIENNDVRKEEDQQEVKEEKEEAIASSIPNTVSSSLNQLDSDSEEVKEEDEDKEDNSNPSIVIKGTELSISDTVVSNRVVSHSISLMNDSRSLLSFRILNCSFSCTNFPDLLECISTHPKLEALEVRNCPGFSVVVVERLLQAVSSKSSYELNGSAPPLPPIKKRHSRTAIPQLPLPMREEDKNKDPNELSPIRSLILWQVGLDQEGVSLLSSFLSSHECFLHTLSIGSNSAVGAVGLKCLVDSIGTNTRLKSLDVSGTGLSKNGGLVLASYLQKNTTLTTLAANSNKLGDEAVLTIADALVDNTNLEQLDLRWNNTSEICWDGLAELLQTNQILKEVEIGGLVGEESLEFVENINKSLAANKERAKKNILHEDEKREREEKKTADVSPSNGTSKGQSREPLLALQRLKGEEKLVVEIESVEQNGVASNGVHLEFDDDSSIPPTPSSDPPPIPLKLVVENVDRDVKDEHNNSSSMSDTPASTSRSVSLITGVEEGSDNAFSSSPRSSDDDSTSSSDGDEIERKALFDEEDGGRGDALSSTSSSLSDGELEGSMSGASSPMSPLVIIGHGSSANVTPEKDGGSVREKKKNKNRPPLLSFSPLGSPQNSFTPPDAEFLSPRSEWEDVEPGTPEHQNLEAKEARLREMVKQSSAYVKRDRLQARAEAASHKWASESQLNGKVGNEQGRERSSLPSSRVMAPSTKYRRPRVVGQVSNEYESHGEKGKGEKKRRPPPSVFTAFYNPAVEQNGGGELKMGEEDMDMADVILKRQQEREAKREKEMKRLLANSPDSLLPRTNYSRPSSSSSSTSYKRDHSQSHSNLYSQPQPHSHSHNHNHNHNQNYSQYGYPQGVSTDNPHTPYSPYIPSYNSYAPPPMERSYSTKGLTSTTFGYSESLEDMSLYTGMLPPPPGPPDDVNLGFSNGGYDAAASTSNQYYYPPVLTHTQVGYGSSPSPYQYPSPYGNGPAPPVHYSPYVPPSPSPPQYSRGLNQYQSHSQSNLHYNAPNQYQQPAPQHQSIYTFPRQSSPHSIPPPPPEREYSNHSLYSQSLSRDSSLSSIPGPPSQGHGDYAISRGPSSRSVYDGHMSRQSSSTSLPPAPPSSSPPASSSFSPYSSQQYHSGNHRDERPSVMYMDDEPVMDQRERERRRMNEELLRSTR